MARLDGSDIPGVPAELSGRAAEIYVIPVDNQNPEIPENQTTAHLADLGSMVVAGQADLETAREPDPPSVGPTDGLVLEPRRHPEHIRGLPARSVPRLSERAEVVPRPAASPEPTRQPQLAERQGARGEIDVGDRKGVLRPETLKLAEIPVTPADYKPLDPGEIPTESALFRTDIHLDTVLSLALESRDEIGPKIDRPFVVLSAGSSFGAEADSVLAYAERAFPMLGSIDLIGLDNNSRVIGQATAARYIAHPPLVAGPGKATSGSLDAYSDVFQITAIPDKNDTLRARYIIDTSDLRARHSVTFRQVDLVNGTLDLPKADLILCNNLLFHLTAQAAEKVVWNLAGCLTVGGVMSFGADPRAVKMSSNRDGTSYSGWRRQLADKLHAVGIESILYDIPRRAPFVFRKTG